MRATGCNRVVAFSSVVGPVSRDTADGLVWRDLLEQFWQHGRVPDIAGGDFDGTNFQRFLVDPYVYLAPNPAFRAAMFACVPLAFTLGFDARAIQCPAVHCAAMSREGIRRFSGPVPPRKGRLTFSAFWRRQRVLKSGTDQSRPMSRNRLCTNPVVCRSGIPNSTFKVKQVWTAASLKRCCLPRLPLGGGTQTISGSNQIDSEPRRFRLSL